MVKIFNVLLDTVQPISYPSFTVNTNDLKALQVNIIINQDKKALDLTNATVTLAIKKPDNKTVFQDVTVVDALSGSCKLTLNTQAYVVPGFHKAEVMIYYGTDTVAVTSQFSYTANKGIMNDNSIVSTNEFQAISKVVSDAVSIKTEAQQSATSSAESAAAAQILIDEAKGTYPNLSARLTANETSLAQKVNQKHVGLFRKINKKVNFPTGFIWNNAPINIYKNALSEFTTDFDVAKFQHVGAGKTYYVALNGLDTNDGLTSTTPLASVKAAILKADVDIVLIAAGYYPRNQSFSGTDIPKNVSIKAMSGAEGKVTLTPMDYLTYAVDSTYTNTYKVARSAVGRVFDSKYTDVNGDYQELVKRTSVADVNANAGSYYADGTNLYIRLSDSRVPDTLVRVFLATVNLRHIGGSTVYVEGINFEGGMSCVDISNHLTNGLYPKFYAKNCKFKYSSDASGNNVSIKGAQEAYLQDCTAARSINDGFNYHINNGVNPNVIEVNCIGRNNGIESDNDNGSTMHDGGKIIRVNGAYFENIGPNVADVNNGTQCWNLGCIAYDSKAITVLKQCDFQTSETGASGWYDGCVALTTVKSLYADTSIAYTKDCYFEQGVDTNQVY